MKGYDNNMEPGKVTVPASSFDKKSGHWVDPNTQPTMIDTDAGAVPNQWTNSVPITKWDLRKESSVGQSHRAPNFEDYLKLNDEAQPVEEPIEPEVDEEKSDMPDGGNCFDSAYDFISRNGYRKPELRLVHGFVSGQGSLKGYRFTHGWCEDGHTVYDNANGKERSISKILYYALGNIRPEECKYYDYEQAMETSLEHGHKGPWEIENTHFPEDWTRDNKVEESNYDFTPMVHYIEVKPIGIKDKNGQDILVGDVIQHNDNLYVIKWSTNRQEIVARKQPLRGQLASWRDINWITRVRPFITVVGSVVTNNDLYRLFREVLPINDPNNQLKINNKNKKQYGQ